MHNQYFKKNIDYVRNKIATSIRGSTDQFAKHFRDNYLSNIAYYEDLPPFWIAAELTTFGMLTSIMEALDKNQFGPQRSNHLDILAQQFRAATWSDLLSWLQLIKAIRNCASHSNRTWNRNYRQPSGLIGNPQHLLMPPTMSNKIYPGLTIIYLMTKNNLLNGNCFKQELQTLLGRFAHIQNLEHRMGMPANWDREPAWQ